MIKLNLMSISSGNAMLKNFARRLHYVQGQEPEPKIREYFYYIDHQGMVRL